MKTVSLNAAPLDVQKVEELERQIMDLKITNRGKDYFIDQLKGERNGLIEKLLSTNQIVGQLENIQNQLDTSKL